MAKHPLKPRKKTAIRELIDRTKIGEDPSDVYLSMVKESYRSGKPLMIHTPILKLYNYEYYKS